jgi:hypothetical protein
MSIESIPAGLSRYVVPKRVLDESRSFLRARGLEGYEAVILWLGRVVDDTTAQVTSAYAPQQIGRSSARGVSVEVTQDGLAKLISSLAPGEFVLIRVHSHPGEAYHSDLDDANLLISHDGAISIVVPDFAKRDFELSGCSVNELRHGHGWRELDPNEVAARFEVV